MSIYDWDTPVGIVLFFLGVSTSVAILAVGLGYLLRSIAVLRTDAEKLKNG